MYGKQNIAVFRYALELYTQVLAIRANAVKAAANGATRSEPTVTTFSVWGICCPHNIEGYHEMILNSELFLMYISFT